jgi:hypothetical protein
MIIKLQTKHTIMRMKRDISRAVFTHGPKGPGPRAANFQGRHIKKIEIEVWYAGKKRLSTREKFRADLY